MVFSSPNCHGFSTMAPNRTAGFLNRVSDILNFFLAW